MIVKEIEIITSEIDELEYQLERLKNRRAYMRKLMKLHEIDVRLGIDRRRKAELANEERRNRR